MITGLHRVQAKGGASENEISRLQRFIETTKVAAQPFDSLFGSAGHGP